MSDFCPVPYRCDESGARDPEAWMGVGRSRGWDGGRVIPRYKSRGGLMVSAQVRQSEGSGFKSRSGQIAYFHGVNTRLSTLGTCDVPRGSDFTVGSVSRQHLGDIKQRLERLGRLERLESPLPVYFGNSIGITVEN